MPDLHTGGLIRRDPVGVQRFILLITHWHATRERSAQNELATQIFHGRAGDVCLGEIPMARGGLAGGATLDGIIDLMRHIGLWARRRLEDWWIRRCLEDLA